MILYADLYVMRGILTDGLILLLLRKINRLQTSAFRIFTAALLGSIGDVFGLWLEINGLLSGWMLQLLNVVLCIGMLRICFPGLKKIYILWNVVMMYFLSFLAFGVQSYLKRLFGPLLMSHIFHRSWLLVGGAVFGYLFLSKAISLFMEYKNKVSYECEVLIQISGKQFTATALYDSGNKLYEPITHTPVVLAEKELLEEANIKLQTEKSFVIPYQSVGRSKGILFAYRLDFLCLKDQMDIKHRDVMMAVVEDRLSPDGSYHILLHSSM